MHFSWGECQLSNFFSLNTYYAVLWGSKQMLQFRSRDGEKKVCADEFLFFLMMNPTFSFEVRLYNVFHFKHIASSEKKTLESYVSFFFKRLTCTLPFCGIVFGRRYAKTSSRVYVISNLRNNDWNFRTPSYFLIQFFNG